MKQDPQALLDKVAVLALLVPLDLEESLGQEERLDSLDQMILSTLV